MLVVKGLLLFIHVVISILLVVVILLQASKGGGLAGLAGGQASSALFGTRGTATALARITQYLAGAFLVLSLTLSFLAGAGTRTESVTQRVLDQTPASQLPPVENLEFETGTAGGSDAETVPGAAETDEK